MFCHSLPKVALVKSISLVKTKKINLMNMMGGCGWKNVILSQDLNLQFFFEAKNENFYQDLNTGPQKGYIKGIHLHSQFPHNLLTM